MIASSSRIAGGAASVPAQKPANTATPPIRGTACRYPGAEARFVPGQEQRHAGDVLGHADAAQRRDLLAESTALRPLALKTR